MQDKLKAACICNICTCGQHRCPHQPHTKVMEGSTSPQPCSFSEYTRQFQKYSSRPRKPIRPKREPISQDVKMACATTNRQDFISHPVTPRAPIPPPVYKQPEGTVSSATEYRKEFEEKAGQPAAAIRPADAQKDQREPFKHKSTQATDFVTFQFQPRESYAVKRVYEPPKESLESKTTATTDFVDFGSPERTASLKPPQTPKLSTDPFDGMSCYRQMFTPQPIPERYKVPKVQYKPSPVQFSGLSSYTKDFPVPREGIAAQSLKPPPKPVSCDSPFDGRTTSRLSYRTWDLPEKHVRPPTVYCPPKEKLATKTTFQNDFPDYGRIELTKALRPVPREKNTTTPLESVTTQRADYPLWDASQIKRSELIPQGKKYEPSPDKFNFVSTCQAHYKGTPGPRAASIKPSAQPYTSNDKMESSTMYRESFSRSGFVPCPASTFSKVPPSSPGYSLSHKNEATGHVFFTPATQVSSSMQIPVPASM